jgi:hypothetical protein
MVFFFLMKSRPITWETSKANVVNSKEKRILEKVNEGKHYKLSDSNYVRLVDIASVFH